MEDDDLEHVDLTSSGSSGANSEHGESILGENELDEPGHGEPEHDDDVDSVNDETLNVDDDENQEVGNDELMQNNEENPGGEEPEPEPEPEPQPDNQQPVHQEHGNNEFFQDVETDDDSDAMSVNSIEGGEEFSWGALGGTCMEVCRPRYDRVRERYVHYKRRFLDERERNSELRRRIRQLNARGRADQVVIQQLRSRGRRRRTKIVSHVRYRRPKFPHLRILLRHGQGCLNIGSPVVQFLPPWEAYPTRQLIATRKSTSWRVARRIFLLIPTRPIRT